MGEQEFDSLSISDELGSGDLDLYKIIFIQIARVCKTGSRNIRNNTILKSEFEESVLTLLDLSSPFHDELFETEKENIKNLDGKPGITSIEEWRALFRAILKCLRRAGLLPAEEIELIDDGFN